MAKSIIQQIKFCANKLKNSKLARLGGKEISEALDNLTACLGLETSDEAIVFIPIFEKECSGRTCDFDEMSTLYDCSNLDMMEYIPAIKNLLEKGLIYINTHGMKTCKIVEQSFGVTPVVLNSIIDNKTPNLEGVEAKTSDFDRYALCSLVSNAVQDSDVTFRSLLQVASDAEKLNANMTFVQEVRRHLEELSDRILFYEICNDFSECPSRRSSIERTLEDIYDSFGNRISARARLLDGTNTLISNELVYISDDREEMTLTEKGKEILLENDYASFGDKLDCPDRYKFARMVTKFFHDDEKYDSEARNALIVRRRELLKMESHNKQLSCIRKVREIIRSEGDRILFYMACNYCPGGINLINELKCLFSVRDRAEYLNLFKEEKHKLQELDLVEITSISSLFGPQTGLVLTDKGKELFFEEDAKLFIQKVDKKDLVNCQDIKPKQLFFSENEQRQLSMVGDSLMEENYRTLTERLESKGLSKGIAVLLYGAPGTGKTESVMQWARQSGRDIVHVDLSASKSMWYGESEKIVKDIFTRYRQQCKRSKIKPILLFNEADGLFSKRKDMSRGSSVDQTENTIQNILLEEMEKLDGILIATTNLEENLDKAFERRFLFKIRLDKPGVEAKKNIWQDKLPILSAEQAHKLASDFDFSGGEIDNIVRKTTMQEVLEGGVPTMESIVKLCSQEKVCTRNNRIGF